MNKFLNFILRPLCWFGLHPIRSSTGKGGSLRRCDVCGRFVKGAN